MRRAILIAVVLSFFVNSGKAEAQSSELVLSAAKLLDACTRADYHWIAFCNGYLQAAFDATGGSGICPPRGATRNDFFDVVIPKLKQSPDLQKLDSFLVVTALLRQAYPCN